MVLSSTPYHHVEYYQDHDIIVSQWYGPCTSQEYREALGLYLHFISSMNIPYAISDRRLLPPLNQDDIRWTLEEYLNVFRALPLRRFALIKSFNPIAEEQIKHFVFNKKENRFPFEIQFFEDLTSAYEWLIDPDQE